MNIFDIENFTKSNLPLNPSWVENGNLVTKQVYSSVLSEVEKIESLIDTGSELSLRERTIIASKVATQLNIDKSNIRKSRRPELVEFIEQENQKLISRYEALKIRTRTGRHKSKSETLSEHSKILEKLRIIENMKMKEFLEEAIEKDLLSTQRQFRSKYNELRIEVKALHEQVGNLTNSNQELIKQLALIMSEKEQLEYQYMELRKQDT